MPLMSMLRLSAPHKLVVRSFASAPHRHAALAVTRSFGFGLGLGLALGAGIGVCVSSSVADRRLRQHASAARTSATDADLGDMFTRPRPPADPAISTFTSSPSTAYDADAPPETSPWRSSEPESVYPQPGSAPSIDTDYSSNQPTVTNTLVLASTDLHPSTDINQLGAVYPMSFFSTTSPSDADVSKRSASSRQNTASSASSNASFIADAVEKVIHSVVNISVETDTTSLLSSSGSNSTTKTLVSSGSGFFVTENGCILTNAHVVSDISESSRLWVTTWDGHTYRGAVHCMDILSDLAIVRLLDDDNQSGHGTQTAYVDDKNKSKSRKSWPSVTFGTNQHLRPGDWVIAIGSPFGLQNTVTAGIISSLLRRNDEIGTLDRDTRVEYIQTDCVVHSGSSGGPLVNVDGQVVGINTTRAESEGISFAIRVDGAREMVEQMVKHGRVMRPWLGIHTVTLSPQVWNQIERGGFSGGMIRNDDDGYVVPSNALGDPSLDPMMTAVARGVTPGSGGVGINDGEGIRAKESAGAIGGMLGSVAQNQPSSLQPSTIIVHGNASSRANPNHQIPHLPHGVLVTHVEPFSPAHTGGVLEGDIITAINHHPIASSQDLLKRIGLRVGETFDLTLTRSVPVDMDWDGRTLRFEQETHVVQVTPAELDVFLQQQLQQGSVGDGSRQQGLIKSARTSLSNLVRGKRNDGSRSANGSANASGQSESGQSFGRRTVI